MILLALSDSYLEGGREGRRGGRGGGGHWLPVTVGRKLDLLRKYW